MARVVLPTALVDLDALELVRDGVRTPLTTLEARLLGHLARAGDRVVPREELLVEVWGYRPGIKSRAVDNVVSRLRAKLEPEGTPPVLFAVAGRGYRLRLGASPAPRPGLPRAPTLVGRSALLGQILAALEPPGAWVTLHGRGGAGKTALALAAAHSLQEGGEALFVDLTGVQDPEAFLATVCAALELPGTDVGALAATLAWRRPLLVLDNLDDVAPALGPLLAAFAGARVLATSRVAVGPRVIGVGPLAPDDARSLYEGLCAERGEAVGPMLARLDHLPLAIRLAAARSVVLPPASLLDRLDRDVLAGGEGRHASLWATIAASVDPLPPATRAALARLAVPPGAFSLEIVEALGVSFADLERLSEHALVLAEGGEHRLYDQVRAWARAHLAPVADALLGVRRHFLAMPIDRASSAAGTAELRRLARQAPLLERVLDETTDPDEHARLVLLLDRVLAARGPAKTRLARLQAAAPRSQALLAEVHLRRAEAEHHLGLAADAEASARRSLEAAGSTAASIVLHRVLCGRGAFEGAEAVLAQAEGRHPGALELALERASFLRRRGRGEGARAAYLALVAPLAARGRVREEAEARVGLSQVARGPAELMEATAHLERAIELFHALDDPRGEQGALTALGLLYVRLASWDLAEEALRRALEGHRRLGQPSAAAMALSHLGMVAAGRGDMVAAARWQAEALARHQENGAPVSVAIARGNLGAVRLHEGRISEARDLLASSVEELSRGGHRAAGPFQQLLRIALVRGGSATAPPPVSTGPSSDAYERALGRVADAWLLARGDRLQRAQAAQALDELSVGEVSWEPWVRALVALQLGPLRAALDSRRAPPES